MKKTITLEIPENKDYELRETLIRRIEGKTGTLLSFHWELIETDDLRQLYRCLEGIK